MICNPKVHRDMESMPRKCKLVSGYWLVGEGKQGAIHSLRFLSMPLALMH